MSAHHAQQLLANGKLTLLGNLIAKKTQEMQADSGTRHPWVSKHQQQWKRPKEKLKPTAKHYLFKVIGKLEDKDAHDKAALQPNKEI